MSSKFKSLSLSMQGGIHKDQEYIGSQGDGIYDNLARQQTGDAGMLSRHNKIKNAARIAHGSTKHAKTNSAVRNPAALQLMNSSAAGNYHGSKRYDSSVKTTNAGGSSVAQS